MAKSTDLSMLFKKASIKITRYWYWIISYPIRFFFESGPIRKYGRNPLRHQPIFIIGAPRTGSTILYQIITDAFDVLYIDNLIQKWYRNLFWGFKRSYKKFGNSPHNCFKSTHGDTSNHGLHAPSEFGEFWYRWITTGMNYLPKEEINQKMIDEITKNISAVVNYFDKPIVIKNNNVGLRLHLIHQCFPDAKFIYIKRDLFQNVQSILSARQKIFNSKRKWWSMKPSNYELIQSEDNYIKQIYEQIKGIENDIERDLNLFKRENVYQVAYEDVCTRTSRVLDEIKQFIGTKEREKYEGKYNLIYKQDVRLDENEQFLFKQISNDSKS